LVEATLQQIARWSGECGGVDIQTNAVLMGL